jgi:hypothetical protein
VIESVEFLRRVVAKLDAAGISYMVTGSMASGALGEPRASFDVDIVIEPTIEQLRMFVASLGDEFYVSDSAAEEAFKSRGFFNIVEQQSGMKADLIVRKDRPFAVVEFRRRRPGRVAGVDLVLVSPEDSILSKLEWAKRGETDRQFRDAVGVAAVQGANLDRAYLRKWARDLGVEDLVLRLFDEVQGES